MGEANVAARLVRAARRTRDNPAPIADSVGRIENLDLINEELIARLSRQSSSTAGVDTKAAVVLGFTATAAQFLATRHTQPVLAGFAFASYAVAFGFGIGTLAVATFKELEPRYLYNNYALKEKNETLTALAATRVRIFEKNEVVKHRKVAKWWIALLALTLGLVLSVAAMVHTGGHGTSTEPEQRPTSAATHQATSSRR